MSAIIPGILEKDWTGIEKKLRIVRPFADTVHIDLLDGKFADNTSWMDPEPFREYAKDMTLELHMMVEDPLQYIKPFAESGFKRFLGHIEMMPNQTEFIAEAQEYGEVGLVLDAHTKIHDLTVSLDDLDALLIMTVKAGFSGQHFLPTSLQKVRHFAAEDSFLPLEVDGGIRGEHLSQSYEAGARRFVATSAIFGADDPKRAYNELSEIFAKLEEASVLLQANGNN